MRIFLLFVLLAITSMSLVRAQDTGLKSPTSFSNNNSVSNPANGYSSNDAYAVFDNSNDRVDYGTFDFSSLPFNASIEGIVVKVEGKRNGGRDLDVRLTWNGGSNFTSSSQISGFGGSDAVFTLGGSTNTWGHGWTVPELGGTNFMVRCDATGGGNDLSIDHIQVQVYYSLPGLPPISIPQAVFESVNAGSLIIPMNNLDVGSGQGNENRRGQQTRLRRAYGLVYTLLANDIDVKWAFSTTKTHDGADFQASANQVKRRRGDTTITSSFNYKGSAFIIDVQDTAVAGPILRNSTFNLVTVHQVLTAFGSTVPVVHTLSDIPKALIFDNSASQLPALVNVFVEASIPSSAYATSTTMPSVGGMSAPTCYSILMLPHDEGITSTQINSIHDFLMDGGNVYAQCAAIDELENASGAGSTYGRTFTTMTPTGGISRSTTSDGNSYAYPDTGATLGYGQFVGDFENSLTSQTPYWRLSTGSRYRDGFIDVARTNSNFDVTNLYTKITAKRFQNIADFGWVFYCGGHNHTASSSGGQSGGNFENLPRMALNAFFTPSSRLLCQLLPVQLVSFTARIQNVDVLLRWRTATEVNNFGFEVQRSADGSQTWTSVGFIPGNGTSNVPNEYSFIDRNAKNAGAELLYRLKQIDRNGAEEYSGILVANFFESVAQPTILSVYPNPVSQTTTALRFGLPASTNVSLTVQDMLGREVLTLHKDEAMESGEHTVSLDMNGLMPGTYVAILKTSTGAATYKITVSR